MKHLYYIRHGLSLGNIANVWTGHINTPLSPEGHEQAKRAGEKARERGLAFDIVISSPLDRAHHTAQHVSNAVGYPIQDIVLRPEFIERHFGELEGLNNQDAVNLYIQSEALIDSYENVERFVDLQWRAQKALEYLHSLPHENVLVVGHGAFGRSLKRAIAKEPLTTKIEPLANAELIQLL